MDSDARAMLNSLENSVYANTDASEWVMNAQSQQSQPGAHENNIAVNTLQKLTAYRVGGGKRGTTKKLPIPPPPRATPSSSSGYPGVSWNKRMGAWLAFYYDSDTRRSRTFHPKYYDMDVEKAKMAAIDFMKSIERHPRCSLRKSRKDPGKVDSANVNSNSGSYEVDGNPYRDFAGRSRRRCTNTMMNLQEFKNNSNRSPLSCSSSQTSMHEMYHFDSLKRNFMLNTGKHIEGDFLTGIGSSIESDSLLNAGKMLDGGYLGSSFDSQDNFDKGVNGYRGGNGDSNLTWGGCQNFFMNGTQDYYGGSPSSAKFGMPFFEGDMTYSSPSRKSNPFFAESGDVTGGNLYINRVGDFDTSPLNNDDMEIHRLMQSMAPSPSESFEGFRLNAYNCGANSFGNDGPHSSFCNTATGQQGGSTAFNCTSTPLGSPYLSPYAHTLYNSIPEDSELGRISGFQSLILSNDAQGSVGHKKGHNCLHSPRSPYDIVQIDSN